MRKLILRTTMSLAAILSTASAMRVEGSLSPPPMQASPSGFASVTINPNFDLPDGNPTFTCFDMELVAPAGTIIADVEVVVGHTHTWVGDLIYQIWHPDGDHVTMMHRPGRTGAGFGDSSELDSSSPITFGDAYADNAETMGNTIGDTQVICQDDGRCEYFPNRDEDLTSLLTFGDMAGANVAGTWQFCASDNAGGDTGPLGTVTLTVTYRPTFDDVPLDYWAWQYIEALSDSGITSGCSVDPPLYCPENSVTRAQMAVFLKKGIHGADYSPLEGTGIFDDVPDGYWAEDWIEDLYNEGITAGCSVSPPLYCPEGSVTRAQMAVFLLKSKYGSGYTPLEGVGLFDDVPDGYWAEDWIEALYNEGITAGCSVSPPLYCPEDEVTRAQMAVFLVKTFNLPLP